MAALSADARRFHEGLLEYYLSELADNGVSDCQTYFEKLGAFEDGRITEREAVRELLSSGPGLLESFYRVAPTVDQDVMLATLNPGMQSELNLASFNQGEYARHREVGMDLEAKAAIVAEKLDNFLLNSGNAFRSLIEILCEELDLLEFRGDIEQYVDCTAESPLDGFFGDVCYTYMYKLATPDHGKISDIGGPSQSNARRRFAEEIFDVVSPRVLVSVGKHAWVTVWEYLDSNYPEDPEDMITEYSENSPLTKSYNPRLGKGAYSGLYYVEPENLWVLTTWHASYWIKTKRLRHNTRILNDQLV